MTLILVVCLGCGPTGEGWTAASILQLSGSGNECNMTMLKSLADYSNRFGHFAEGGKAYVITDSATPMPWTNVVCNGRFGFVVSQNGGGFSWFDDAQHCVLTRWEMDLARDCYGKFIFLSDLETGEIWSATPAPTFQGFDKYSCTHRAGATTFATQSHGIEVQWTMSVASDAQAELWTVKISNVSGKARRIRVSSYFEWTCGVAPDTKREFHRLFFSTSYNNQNNRRAILATKHMWDIPPKSEKQHWNQPWPYMAAHSLVGPRLNNPIAIGDKRAFLNGKTSNTAGGYGQTFAPGAMKRDAQISEGKTFGRFGDQVAALGGELSLEAGNSVELGYVVAIGTNEQEVLATVDRFDTVEKVKHATTQMIGFWDKLLSKTSVESSRADFDLLNNRWLSYQAISGRLWGRTGYYQQSGARGFRDQLQDSHVWGPLEPSKSKDQIALHMTRQFVDGSVNHWWHGLADFGNHTKCSDDYLWLAYLTSSYLKETGEYGVLRELKAGFRDNPGLVTDLLDHCERAIARAFMRTSARGLPFIGSCDWNDGLSAVGIEEKGESIWLAWFLCEILRDWTTIYSKLGMNEKAEGFKAKREQYLAAINAHAWDGRWYRVASMDSGQWLGSAANKEGSIHLNPQTWAIITDGAPADREELAWESVKRELVQFMGPLLLTPAYQTPEENVGYITRYAPGARENGGVYMHAATWALLAACKRKDVQAAQKIFDSISPPLRGRDADGYMAEPYVMPGNVDGPLGELPGKAGWTWYTGSAAWLNKVCLEWVVGLRPTLSGLVIDPCPLPSMGTVKVSRQYRGRSLQLSFDGSTFGTEKQARVIVQGVEVEDGVLTDDVLTLVPSGGVINIEVRWTDGGTEALHATKDQVQGIRAGQTVGARRQ